MKHQQRFKQHTKEDRAEREADELLRKITNVEGRLFRQEEGSYEYRQLERELTKMRRRYRQINLHLERITL